MKLNELRESFENLSFDLDHEADMVQSRILSTILDVIDKKGMKQSELAELTGLKQPFISALFNIRRKLNMEHIALFQKALEIQLQPPSFLSNEDHYNEFYNSEIFDEWETKMMDEVFLYNCKSMKSYTNGMKLVGYEPYPLQDLYKDLKNVEKEEKEKEGESLRLSSFPI